MLHIDMERFREKEFMQRMKRLEYAHIQQLKNNMRDIAHLHIVYVMHQVEPYGGTKIILQHANKLVQYGVKVTLVSHFPKPDWHPVFAEYVCVPFKNEVAEGIPDCDVIVATSWNHINSCIETAKAPVVFFEQGGSHLFDWDNLSTERKRILAKMLTLPKFVFTVSINAAKLLNKIYGIQNARVFYNALDENIFYNKGDARSNEPPYLLMVGSDKDEFKRIPDIVDAFEIVKREKYNLELCWITKDSPEQFYGNVYIRPDQSVIGDLYRGAKVFVSASIYESFSLPVLEAMACGCPVVTTKNAGVTEYAKNNYNCIFAQKNDPQSLSQQVIRLLNDEKLYAKLSKNGVKTAKQFDWDNIIPSIIDYYKEIAMYRPI